MKPLFPVFCAMLMVGSVAAQPYGIPNRIPNNDLIIDELPPTTVGSFNLQRVFGTASFNELVDLAEAPGNTSRLYAVEQNGMIKTFLRTFDNSTPTVTDWLNFQTQTRFVSGGEQGLLSIAFDPGFQSNGYFYICYTFDNGQGGQSPTRVSRLQAVPPTATTVNAATEVVLLTIPQPASNHNGGKLNFGPDGMLYISTGDGGGGNDQFNQAQDTTTLNGNILRIDVTGTPDPGLNYRIPPDNPFYNGGPAGANTRREIYAYGLRNPWRTSFDALNGWLLLGDVGQGPTNAREEVNHIVSGGNYGWPLREGTVVRSQPSRTDLLPPLLEYSHTGSRRSITGGYVYYGSRLPELYGVYVFSDYNSREIFGTVYNGTTATPLQVLAFNSNVIPTAFGQTSDGEVYVLSYFGGIYQLVRQAPTPPTDFPTRLSDIPALLSTGSGDGESVPGVIPYAPAAPFWSDYARKERYMAIPGVEPIEWQLVDGWDFPEKSLIVKNFVLPIDERDPEANLKRIETRLLYKRNDQWHGFSYEWNDQETDAQLLTTSKLRPINIINEAGNPTTVNWYYPSRTECFACHTPASNFTLGLTTAQMNCEFLYTSSSVTDNQLRTLDFISAFDPVLPQEPAQLPAKPNPFDVSQSLEDRARAWLATNCGMCHRPGGGGLGGLDLRWETLLANTNLIDTVPSGTTLGIPDARIVAPGEPDRSILLQRIDTLDAHRMPPLGSLRIDVEGVALITEWIESLGATREGDWNLFH